LLPQAGYAREKAGLAFSGGMWLQQEHFVIEPRASIRFDVNDDKRDYLHIVPIEVGFYWLNNFDDLALYAGPGGSLEIVSQEVDLKSTVGSEIVATSERKLVEAQVCAGVFARAGLIFGRSGSVSPTLSVDYALTFVDFEETSLQRAIRINVGLTFGKGR
jgi:hypothetical protein